MRKPLLIALSILGLSFSAVGCGGGESTPEAQSPEIIGGEAMGNDSSGESGEVEE